MVAKNIDSYNPRFVDILDKALQKFAYQYNNPLMDDSLEFKLQSLKNSNLMPRRIREDDYFGEKLATYSTEDFLINYLSKAFMDENYSPQYTLLKILNLLNDVGEDKNAYYLPRFFKDFKSKYIDGFIPNKNTINIPENLNHRLLLLSEKYFNNPQIIEYLSDNSPAGAFEGAQGTSISGSTVTDILSGAIGIGIISNVPSQSISQPPQKYTSQPKESTNYVSDEDIARFARNVGFDKQSAITMVAIALAESGGNTHAIGDVAIAGNGWGPSVGLWQVRTRTSETGTGGNRDINKLFDPEQNARAAYSISGAGKNYKPWTTWRTGAYRKYLDRAEQAVAEIF